MTSLHQPVFFIGDESVTRLTDLLLSYVAVTRIQYDVCSIDDVRRLKELVQLRPATGEEQVIGITANGIGLEAQQALLKTLEEPTLGVRIVWALPTGTVLLPTIQSRVQIVYTKNEQPVANETVNFARAPIAQRLEIIKAIATEAEKSEVDPWPVFFADIVRLITRERSAYDRALLERLEFIIRAVKDRGAPKKMFAEELCFTLPVYTAR
jgi:hypothetical protein